MAVPLNLRKAVCLMDKKISTDVPIWWKTRTEHIQSFIEEKVKNGTVNLISVSAGGRNVWSVSYGEPEPELRGKANFNSALGSGNPDAFYKRRPGIRKRPVLVILAGVHGQETEGIASAFSVLHLMEKGVDLEGKEQPALLEKLKKLRLIVIPLANPDGRARVPYDGWVGQTKTEMTIYGQGTKKNGELYNWQGAKEVHPMRGDVDLLGAYFDDAGENLMDDERSAPMSNTTKALLAIARDEGPDMMLNLHSCMHDPFFFPVPYIPSAVKMEMDKYAAEFYKALEGCGYAHGCLPLYKEDGLPGTVPPAFHLSSMLYHTGVNKSLVFESPHGVTDNKDHYGYSDILKIHHILFETAADYTTGDGRL